MDTNQARELLKRYISGECSEQERLLVEQTFLEFNEHSAPLSEEAIERIGHKINKKLPVYRAQRKAYWLYGSVAALLIIGLVSPWLITPFFERATPAAALEISYGGNKATLILPGGKVIDLAAAKNGQLAIEAGTQINKTAAGQLIYQKAEDDVEPSVVGNNTVITPNGGTYQLVLPDGTKVWLNAASRIIFPLSFSGSPTRNVELDGEAYFEVAKDARRPFVVMALGQKIEVLGTHFNVNAYGNNLLTKTTLLEGSVKVGNTVIVPGQQVAISAEGTKVSEVDTDQDVAWQKGEFMFSEKPLSEIMQDVSRWYDVEVDFSDVSLGKKTFGGTISRFSKLTRVLQLLEMTGEVKFKINGRRVLVRH